MKLPPLYILLNYFIKFINFCISVIAIAILIITIYFLIIDWGTLETGYYIGWSIIIILFAIIINMIIYTGTIGIQYQKRRIGSWTGNHILFIYQFGILCSFIIILLISTKIMKLNKSYSQTLDQLQSSSSSDPSSSHLDYNENEQKLSDKFNELYFSASIHCGDSTSQFIWSFVNSHCPTEMGSTFCEKCYDYEVTMCVIDETSCKDSSNPYSIVSCPYELCREPILQYLTNYLGPIGNGLLIFAIIEIVLMFITCLSICSLPLSRPTRNSNAPNLTPIPSSPRDPDIRLETLYIA